MNDRKAFTLINILRNIVTIFFDTFFAIYFFDLTNYDLMPLSTYYLVVYISLLLGFWLLKNIIKKDIKIPCYRIGISFTALYLALIMLLKEKIVDYIYIVGIVKGLGEGFYYYPRNILNTEKIDNNERVKYDGIVNSINQVSSILIPLLLGILLTYYNYITIGKFVFILIVVSFVLSFFVKEGKYSILENNVFSFFKKIISNRSIRNVLLLQFFKGFTITGGVITSVMTIYKILYFKSNFLIGSLNSILSVLTLISCIIYATKIKKTWYKRLIIFTTLVIIIMLIILGLYPNNYAFIIYLVIYAIGITIITLLSDTIIANESNNMLVKDNKEEFHLILETMLGISRIGGYFLLFIISLIGNVTLLKYILFFSVIPFSFLGYYLIKNLKSIN